jgi:hypothetical protein
MAPLDQNIKARCNNRAELIEFLEHYDLPFPCSMHIGHGVLRSVWLVAPERPDRAVRPCSGRRARPTTGATESTKQKVNHGQETQPAGPCRGA